MFLVFDIETTGTVVVDNELLTMYCVKLDKNLNVISEQAFTFKPEHYRDYYDLAVPIHGINKRKALTFSNKKEELKRFIKWVGEKHYFVCHSNKQNTNGYYAFDTAFLKWECLGSGLYWDLLNVMNSPVLSTHQIAQSLYKERKLDIKATVKEGNKRASVGLGLDSLCKFFSIPLNHHDAKSDTLATCELFKKLINIDKNVLIGLYEI